MKPLIIGVALRGYTVVKLHHQFDSELPGSESKNRNIPKTDHCHKENVYQNLRIGEVFPHT